MNKIITRFAPSPTGPLHLGSVRTALINYIVTIQAKKVNEESKFILRIEDTDKERSKDEYITNIINSLKWLNIDWDNEIVIQSKNVLRHIEIANELINKKGAYKCICSSEKIEEIRKKRLKEKMSIKRLCETCQNDSSIQNLKENYCVRIKIPNDGSIKINDLIQGEVSIQNKEIDNFILLKKDNSPTYMLSSVVDDYDSKINTVIRGNDHFNNAFRQYYIYKYLNWKFPFYAHLPLVHGLDGSKLSKRHGSVNVYDFKDNGYLPKALINNLILLGWSPNNNSEIIEMDEIIKKFDIKKISKSSSIFNYKKLDFFNNY
ncbi:MAG: Glutamate--tRNA ligase, partial [Alphaproteobacteria bacterium MarineAlpha5_Bin9]